MFLTPKATKFIKYHIRSKRLKEIGIQKNFTVGDICLIATESGFISGRQLESIRTTLRRKLKKQAKILIKVAPNSTITKKPNETRMGKGKGDVSYWVSTVKPGQVIIEIKGSKLSPIRLLLNNIKKKLRMRSSIMYKPLRWIL